MRLEVKSTLVLLTFVTFQLTFPFIGHTKAPEEKRSSETTEIQLIEEKIKHVEDLIRIRFDNIDKNIKDLKEENRAMLDERTKNLENQMRLYISFAGALGAFFIFIISFFGRKAIIKWIQKTLEEIVSQEVAFFVKGTNGKSLFQNQAETAIQKSLAKIQSKANGIFEYLKNLPKDYEESLNELIEKKLVYINEPFSESSIKDIDEFQTTLKQLKKEKEYNFDDYFYSAMAAYQRYDFPETYRLATEALEIRDDAVLYSYRGVAHTFFGDFANSIKDHEKAIALDRNLASLWGSKGFTLTEFYKFEDAIKCYEEAIELDPENIKFYKNVAELRIIIGDYTGGLHSIGKAISLSSAPSDIAICTFLNCIASKLLGENTEDLDNEFNSILQKRFVHYWSFKALKHWFNTAKLSEDEKNYIAKKAKSLKQRSGYKADF